MSSSGRSRLSRLGLRIQGDNAATTFSGRPAEHLMDDGLFLAHHADGDDGEESSRDRRSIAEDQARVGVYAVLQLAVGAVLLSFHYMPENSSHGASASMWFAAASCILGIFWILVAVIFHSQSPPRIGLHIDEIRIPHGLHFFALLAMVVTGMASVTLAIIHVVIAVQGSSGPSACAHTSTLVFSISKALFLIVLALFIWRYISPGHVLHRSFVNTIMLSHVVCTLAVIMSADYIVETKYSFGEVERLRNGTDGLQLSGTSMLNCTSPPYSHVLRRALPYLLPCFPQYALLAAALLVDIWMRSSQFSFSERASTPVLSQQELADSDESSPLLWSLTTHGTFRSPTGSRFHHMSAVHLSAGAILASVILVATMALLAVFARDEGESHSRQVMDNMLYYPYRILLLFVMMVFGGLGLRTLTGAKPVRSSLSVHEIILLIGLCGEIILAGFTIAAWSLSRSSDIRQLDEDDSYPTPKALVVTDNIVRLLQAFSQVAFINRGLHRRSQLSKSACHHFISTRSMSMFLLIANIVFWLVNSSDAVSTNPRLTLIYGHHAILEGLPDSIYSTDSAWLLVQYLLFPLCLFFRLQSAVCLYMVQRWHKYVPRKSKDEYIQADDKELLVRSTETNKSDFVI